MEDEDRYTRITLRIPKDLHQALAAAAEQTSKSLNAEIVGRLAASTAEDGRGAGSTLGGIRDHLLAAIVALGVLQSERAVYQLRMDLAETTDQQITGLEEMAQRLTVVNSEIARCELAIERFKADAMQIKNRSARNLK